MRYHTKKPDMNIKVFGEIYITNHPLYNSGTIFRIKDRGLVIIQQYFDSKTKHTYWGPLENWIANLIFVNKDFMKLFDKYASDGTYGYYATITMRHAMNWLKIKPIKKELWETVFDRTII